MKINLSFVDETKDLTLYCAKIMNLVELIPNGSIVELMVK